MPVYTVAVQTRMEVIHVPVTPGTSQSRDLYIYVKVNYHKYLNVIYNRILSKVKLKMKLKQTGMNEFPQSFLTIGSLILRSE